MQIKNLKIISHFKNKIQSWKQLKIVRYEIFESMNNESNKYEKFWYWKKYWKIPTFHLKFLSEEVCPKIYKQINFYLLSLLYIFIGLYIDWSNTKPITIRYLFKCRAVFTKTTINHNHFKSSKTILKLYCSCITLL